MSANKEAFTELQMFVTTVRMGLANGQIQSEPINAFREDGQGFELRALADEADRVLAIAAAAMEKSE